MKDVPNYLERLGATVRDEHWSCRVLYKSYNAIYEKIRPDELRDKFNAAMDNAVSHYTRNVEKSGVKMEARQIEEAAFAVVLQTLYIYNLWRQGYEQYKNQPLEVSAKDLDHPQSHDQCWQYCEREFGTSYRVYAAALVGMTAEEFLKHEENRRMYFDR